MKKLTGKTFIKIIITFNGLTRKRSSTTQRRYGRSEHAYLISIKSERNLNQTITNKIAQSYIPQKFVCSASAHYLYVIFSSLKL